MRTVVIGDGSSPSREAKWDGCHGKGQRGGQRGPKCVRCALTDALFGMNQSWNNGNGTFSIIKGRPLQARISLETGNSFQHITRIINKLRNVLGRQVL